MNKEFYIAGVKFRPSAEIKLALNEIEEGTELFLDPEPTNRFDPNAIRIVYGNPVEERPLFIGYVPKIYSSEITGLIEIGLDVKCYATKINKTGKTWEMFKVVVREVDEEPIEGPDAGDGPDYDEGNREEN